MRGELSFPGTAAPGFGHASATLFAQGAVKTAEKALFEAVDATGLLKGIVHEIEGAKR